MKIFGIGFHKTGTKTLKSSFEMLGYKVTGYRKDLLEPIKRKKYKAISRVVKEHDAFQDNPWPLLYKTLDKKFPGSKFILTIRDDEKWIKSVVNFFGNESTDMRKWIYGIGYPSGNEELYLRVYKKHNADVKEYFKNRPNDLLLIDLTTGEGWEKICPFLGKQIPKKNFPHINKGIY
ncbi:MAG: hypothetical protein DRJ05_00225 [Bacteroidetes bacterium]|nr:MAG: hypothetical protein DRI89_00115 [Bacteroidota bacterium]RLD62486.1 MAG: hypothetical protein DRJ05_00225 [Bacteroidota bacterium]